jgi:hypothetical protein
LALTFNASFAGSKNIYGWAQDNANANSGWQQIGSWTPTVSATPPSVLSVSPSSGSGNTQTFVFKYSDPNGFGYMHQVEQIVNSTVSYAGGCATTYVQPWNAIFLMNDAGSTWLGPVTPGSNATVQNSQCIVNAAQSSVSGSGNALTFNLALTFNPSFAGSKNIYGWAQDNANANSGWQQIGSWAVNSTGATSISHVLFMLQENHSFDNYFGKMGQYRASKGFTDSFDGLPSNVSLSDANGKAVSPYHLATVCTEDLAPGWDPTHLDVDGGKMENPQYQLPRA